MSIFDKIFGTTPQDPAEKAEREAERNFNTLRDDGVRSKNMGELKYAESCLRKALEYRPDDLPTLSCLVEVLLLLQKPGEALPHLRRLHEVAPGNEQVHLLLASAELQTADYEALRATAASLCENYPDDPRPLYFSAEAAKAAGDVFGAIALLTQSLTKKEDYRAALLLRARILMEMGQHAEALADVRQLAELEPDHEEFLLLRAECLSATGRTEEAEADYRHVRELNPFSPEATLRLGNLYEAAGRLEEALTLCDEAIDLRPDFSEAYKLRGGIKLKLHDAAGAEDDLRKSLELAPETVAEISGNFTNIANEMQARYRAQNPFQF